jgi:predicted transcriptional regulator
MGIKSFLAARRIKKKTTGDAPLRVSDYMTRKLVTFKANQPIEEVVSAIIKYRISGGPVVNDKHELIGLISETDCIKQVSESRYHNLPMSNDTVEKYMVKNVYTID